MTENKNWRNSLPPGFQPIYISSRPYIAFDGKHNRFYFSSAALQDMDMRPGDRIGMAYNKHDDTIIIATAGSSMLIDNKSYLTSSHFAKLAGYEYGLVKYELIPEESTPEYKFFRRITD